MITCLFQMHTCHWKETWRIISKISTLLLKAWARFDATREGKNEEGQQQLHVSCKAHKRTLHVFLGQFESIILYWQPNHKSPCGCRKRLFIYSWRNEIFELLKISSTLWFRSIGETIGCLCDVSFRLRGSLGEEWNNKRTTHRTRISPSLFFLR